MALFYDDKKILASSWLLNYLYQNHCHKITSDVPEYNGYRSDVIKISSLSNKTSWYDNEILGEAADILFANGHIEFQSKNLRKKEDSDIYILERGRQAIKSSYYKKIILKKWAKRLLAFMTVIAVWVGFWLNHRKDEPKNPQPTLEQRILLDTSKGK